jgi:hypothetical protein
MVHETWLPQSADKAVEECQAWGCAKRDSADYELLEKTRAQNEIPFANRLRTQLSGINTGAGTNLTTIVPVWSAVITLRESKSCLVK